MCMQHVSSPRAMELVSSTRSAAARGRSARSTLVGSGGVCCAPSRSNQTAVSSEQHVAASRRRLISKQLSVQAARDDHSPGRRVWREGEASLAIVTLQSAQRGSLRATQEGRRELWRGLQR